MTRTLVKASDLTDMLHLLRWHEDELPAPVAHWRAAWVHEASDREWRGGAIAELADGQWCRFYAFQYEPPLFLGIEGGPSECGVTFDVTATEPPWRERGYEDRMIGGWTEFPMGWYLA